MQVFKFDIDVNFGTGNKSWLKPTIKFDMGFNFACGGYVYEPWLKPAIKFDIKFDIDFNI